MTTYAQQAPPADELKNLSLEELMNLKVTSVSKRPEKLNNTASAIQVITNDDIHRYGATSIPEALYLAGNLQVAQKTSHSWGISARGFNTDLSNKLLVMMDGRTIYTPLFSGVFWERQNYLMEDISRIEVISGPGGTLWGANAVNGVINIRSKRASDTQGLFVEAGGGNELQTLAGLRYGGMISKNVSFRVYGKYDKHDDAMVGDSVAIPAHDNWEFGQLGFRTDVDMADSSHLTFQGDYYKTPASLITGDTSKVTGWNFLGRWTNRFSDKSNISVQAYYDHTYLYDPTPALAIGGTVLAPNGIFKDALGTFDIDFQHHLDIASGDHFVWGLGYRYTDDQNTNSPSLGFLPDRLKQSLYNVFGQIQLTIIPDVYLTTGTKLEHNDYTGFEVEPSARIRFDLGEGQMIWGALSRSVRMPSRIDRDLSEGTPPYFVLLAGGPGFRSEDLFAHEIGYRGQFSNNVTASVSVYYNHYTRIRSTVLDPATIFPLRFRNGLAGETYGAEFNLVWEVTNWWQLATSYNRLKEHVWIAEGEADFNNAHNEIADPKWQFAMRSTFSLPAGVSVNPSFRWVDQLPINNAGVLEIVPTYAELNVRIGWQINSHVELSVSGRNLLHPHHAEYGIPGPTQGQIERNFFGDLSVRF